MKKQEIVVTARTVEQAIAEGAGKLSAPEEAVEFEVLQEPKKGFLGIGEQPPKYGCGIRRTKRTQRRIFSVFCWRKWKLTRS